MSTIPALDLVELLEGLPRGAWVALSQAQARVVAVGSDLRAVQQEAISKGEMEPLMVRVPEAATAQML